MNADKNIRNESVPSQTAKLGSFLLFGTFALLMFGPLAFGAVEPWSIFVVETGSVLLGLAWLFKQSLDGEINIVWNWLFLPMLAFGVLVSAQIAFGMSAYRHDTISGLMLYCAYGLLCFLATQTLTRSSQAKKLALFLAVYGFAIAAFALVQGISSNGKLYWLRQPRLGGWVYGPYVNHNHYAGLMELLIPIPLVLALAHFVNEKERVAAGIAAAVMVATVFLSGSRGGMIAVFVELAIFAVLLSYQKKKVRIAIGAVAFVVVVGSMLVWLGGKELGNRVSSISTEARTEISGGMRLSIDRDGFRMFLRRPIFGWGLRTFPLVYPEYRSFYTNFFVNEAHNDYLQMLAETGVLGFAVMVWFVVVLYRRALRKIGKWNSDVSCAVSLVCTLGITGMLVHSFFDFNLQIPANAALFYVLCAIAAGPPLLQRSKKRKPVATDMEEFLPTSEVV
jgi:O-antigen ligase